MIKETIIKKHINFDTDLKNFSDNLLSKIGGKNILVIGGAGTIGSSYIKQILKYKPSKITVVDINENGLTELTRDLRSSVLLDYNPVYITYPVNLLSDTFDKIFNSETWQVVANFSAHKHVRSEKDKISVEDLKKKFAAKDDFILIDVREPEEFANSRILGSVLIPKAGFFDASALDLLPRDKEIILHCRSGVRSAHCLAIIQGAGFTNSRHLGGGILAWEKQ